MALCPLPLWVPCSVPCAPCQPGSPHHRRAGGLHRTEALLEFRKVILIATWLSFSKNLKSDFTHIINFCQSFKNKIEMLIIPTLGSSSSPSSQPSRH